MSSSTTRALLACLTAVVLVALTGCSGADSSEKSPAASTSAAAKPVTALAKGTCWGAEQLPEALGAKRFAAWVEKYAGGDEAKGASMRDDAAFSDRVDCAEPHALELYNIVGLDPRLEAQVKSYTDLLDPSTPLYRKVRDQVYNRCLAPSVYGAAQRRAGGLPVQLGPSLSAKGGLHVAWDPFPAHLWAKGQHRFVCTFEQDEPGTLMFADLPTRTTPIAARVCVNTPRTYVSCRSPHQAEDIAEMTLDTAIEQGQITGRAAVRKGLERAGRGDQRRAVRQARPDLPDPVPQRLDRRRRSHRTGLPRLGRHVAGQDGLLPGELLRTQALRPAAEEPGHGVQPALTAHFSRCTLCWAAWARGRTTISSMSTCAGSEATQRTASAMSSATSGSATPS